MSIPRNLAKIADNVDSGGVLNSSGGGVPSQTSHSGKFLTTDGSTPSWATVVTGGGPITQNADVITTNQTISAGSNGLSAGPMTINTGVTVTVATGQTYVVL